MFSYATACESTPNVKVNRSKSRNVYMKIISATSRTIKIKIINKSDNTARYSESFTLYKYKDGKYKKIKKISKTPKCLYLIKKNDSKVEKLVCEKHFGKKLSKGKYKIKWIQSKKFTIE
jgi:hypothetical protein